MTCDYARCAETATVGLRFGDGLVRVWTKTTMRQSLAVYCDAHAEIVKEKFLTCDERSLVGELVRP